MTLGPISLLHGRLVREKTEGARGLVSDTKVHNGKAYEEFKAGGVYQKAEKQEQISGSRRQRGARS